MKRTIFVTTSEMKKLLKVSTKSPRLKDLTQIITDINRVKAITACYQRGGRLITKRKP